MALHPEIQWTAERIFPAQMAVITNVRPDHTDVFPSLECYAQALALTIPRNGWVVTTPGPFVPLFEKRAASRGSQVKVVEPADPENWGELELNHHPENLALARAVLQLAGVPPEIAKAGMAQATPDPGAFTICRRRGPTGNNYLANAFAANDPISTGELLQRLFPLPAGLTPVVLYNHRPDRLQRARDFYPILAQLIQDGIDVYSIGLRRPPFPGITHFGCLKPEVLLTKLGTGPFLIIGIGNIDGMGHKLSEYFTIGGTQVWKLP
jgi:poly-gamma-glutamate synthase PgsB/CapB